MADISKISPDDGSTILNVKDRNAVHWSESVGYVGKNQIKVYGVFPKTTAGVTVTRNSDDSLSFSGTATGYAGFFMLRYDIKDNSKDYKLTGLATTTTNMAWGNTYVYDNTGTEIANIQSPNNANDRVVNFSQYANAAYVIFEIKRLNNATVGGTAYPMLRPASISDSTYEPYLTPNTEIDNKMSYADNAVLGAKNVLPNNNDSKVINGITYTVNSDKSITANGTASSDSSLMLYNPAISFLENGKTYIISDGGVGFENSSGKAGIYIQKRTSSASAGDYAYTYRGKEQSFTVDNVNYPMVQCGLYVKSGTTLNNVTFYPMIRLASNLDDTYVPYAMTNRELTDKVTPIKLSDANNLDDYLEQGNYYYEGSVPANAPEPSNHTWAKVSVYRGDASVTPLQVVYAVNNIYMRRYGGNPKSWGAWFKYTGTQI